MVSSTTKMAPDSVASGTFVNWPGAGCGGAAGICGGATKFSMVRGLAASCTVKSVFFRSRTGAPSPLVTLTVRRTLSCAIAGSTDKAQIVKQNRIARIFMRTNPPECSQTSGTRRPEEKEYPQKYERSPGRKADCSCACSLRQRRRRNSDKAHNQRPHPSQNGNPLSGHRLRECMAGRDNRSIPAMALRFGWCGQEAIPHSAYGQQVLGMRRVVLDVLTQSHNKIIDSARVGILAQSPHLFENRFARDNLAAVANEMPQQFGFHEGQAKYLAIGP